MIHLTPPEQIQPVLGAMAAGYREWAGDPHFTVIDEILDGRSALFTVNHPAALGALILSISGGVLWVTYAQGQIAGGPHQKAASVGATIADIEQVARQNGCSEIRIEGRMAWRRLLTGFARDDINGIPVLRKAL